MEGDAEVHWWHHPPAVGSADGADRGNYVIPALELPRIEQLCEKYSIDPGARQPDEGFTF